MKSLSHFAAVVVLPVLILSCDREDLPETFADTAAIHPEIVPPATGRATQTDTIEVRLDEWAVRSAQDTLTSGRIVFRVTNDGAYEHALEVEGSGIEEETSKIAAGGSATLAVDLAAGTYELYCPIEDTHGEHQQLGMRTTIVVR
jgi:plastocyanin